MKAIWASQKHPSIRDSPHYKEIESNSHALLETQMRNETHQLSWGGEGKDLTSEGPVVSSAPWTLVRKEGRTRKGGRERKKETERDAIGETQLFWHGFQVIAATKKENCFPFGSQESTYFPFASPIAVFVHTRLSACGFVMFTFLCWDTTPQRCWVEENVQAPALGTEGGCFKPPQ